MDPAWHAAFDALATACSNGSMEQKQESCWQESAMPQSEMTAGWANGTGGGWGVNSKTQSAVVPTQPRFISSLHPLFFFSSLIPVDRNRLGGHFALRWIFFLLLSHFHFAFKQESRSCPTATD